ncbi:MAG: hypothetical protein ACK5PS_17315 [Desulfopila sp.]
MYLATPHQLTGTYQIRQSYLDPATGLLTRRLVFDLGSNPANHLEPLGEVAVLFDDALEQAVNRHTTDDPGELLEQLLWAFLPAAIRRHLNRFQRTRRYVPGPVSQEEREKISRQFHIFDRRRLYYLHYRAIDQSRLFTLRASAFRPFLDQCRDELEYRLAQREQALKPGEFRNYIYAIFNLQRHFSQSFATFLPEALPEDEIADHFIGSLCDLNRSQAFWAGEPVPAWLHPHLVRYLVMFFDVAPDRSGFAAESIRQFINSHRTFRWPRRQQAVREERIAEIFGRSATELRKLKKSELRQLYRQRAKKMHPDQGGAPADFVELTEAYSALLKGR